MKHLRTPRISWIDTCRGIAILLVLYGHALSNDSQRFLIYAFHMPLFFFLSGFVFKPDRTKPLYAHIYKNIKTILLPYLLFAVLTYLASLILLPPATLSFESISKQLYGIVYGNGNKGYLAFNVALWFLPCLFIAKTIFLLLTKYITKREIIIALLVVFSIMGYILSAYFREIKIVFGIETALTATVFFGSGYLLEKSVIAKRMLYQRRIVFFIAAFVFMVMFAWLNFNAYGTQIDMRLNRLNNYFFFYLAAFSGITFSILLSLYINKNVLLEYLGKHSLLLFAWHTVLYAYFSKHSFPHAEIAFINPALTIIYASSIILVIHLLFERIKLAKLHKQLR